MPPDNSRPLRVVSIQSASLGNEVFSRALRENLSQDIRLQVRSVWLHEEREFLTRVLYRLVDYRLPSRLVAKRNLDVRRARNEAACALLGKRLAIRYLQRFRPDVLHFHTQVPALLSIGCMRRVPTLISADQTATLFAAADHAPAWTHLPSIIMEGRTLRAAARVVFFSEWARQSAFDSYQLDPARTEVIYPGVPVERFRAGACRSEFSAQRQPLVLFMGNDWIGKGGADLYRVFQEHFVDRIQLHVASAWPLPELPGVVVHRNIKPFSPEWFSLYERADLFVLPTRIDAFGLVYLEAMAAGLPVIGTRINAVPEIVVHGETGFLVPPGDRGALAQALDTLVADPALRHRMGAAGRARATLLFDAKKNFRRFGDAFRLAADAGVPNSRCLVNAQTRE